MMEVVTICGQQISVALLDSIIAGAQVLLFFTIGYITGVLTSPWLGCDCKAGDK